ncbi:339L [Invertebrate iridescent virus Kaz2018]|nr:339L [Invertebrate iridescent virus Kaz2018]
MVIQDHIKILNFLLHKMETFYKPPLETLRNEECLNQFIVPVFKEVQE